MSPPLPLALSAAAAGALAGSAYLNARLSLDQDLLTFRILGSAALNLLRAVRADRLNAFYVLERHALDASTAGRPLLLFEGRALSYAQAYDAALRYGAWLRARHGVRPRDVVALVFENSDRFVLLWLALWAVGAKPAFVNHHLRGAALAHCLRAAGARLALVDPRVAGAVAEEEEEEEVRRAVPGMKVVVFGGEEEVEARASAPERCPDAVRSESDYVAMAMLIYTSGTTGLPKAAVVSWAKVYVAAMLTGKGTRMRRDDILYTCMPLYHSAASCLGFCATLFAGATLAIGRKFSTKTFWNEVRETNATIIQYVGETCRYLTVAPPETDPVTGENLDKKHRVRAAVGNGLRPDVWDRFKERFGIELIFEFYAATEGSLGLWNQSLNSYGKGAVGRYGFLSGAFMGMRSAVVKVDNETDLPWRDPATGFCQRVRTGEVGELIGKLPADDIKKRFQGYYNDATATNSKILRDVFKKGDAWFRSGDMVRWDSNGCIYFNDRIGDTFRWKSENVSTAEVAETLGLHPAVLEANVYGVRLPNHDGRAGCVAIVLDAPAANEALLADLAAHAVRRLPRYAVPLFLRLRKEVAMGNTGTNKLQKNTLRDQGVDPSRVEGDALFWLKEGKYVPFTPKDWKALEQGVVKL